MSKKRREEGCRCGSGKKYKKCCMIKSLSRLGQGAVAVWEDDGAYDVQGVASVRPPRTKLWHHQNWSD